MAAHSSTLAWKIPWAEEPDRLPLHGVAKSNMIEWLSTHVRAHTHTSMSYAAAVSVRHVSVVSDSVRPHRRQPTRLPCPWDSPGKNTGVGCHFLLKCMKVKRESEVGQSYPSLRDPMDCSPPGSSIHGIFQARVLEWGAISFSDKPPTVFQ